MNQDLLGMADLVRATRISKHRIVYALERGALPEPPRLAGRRCFSVSDIARIEQHFATRKGRGVEK